MKSFDDFLSTFSEEDAAVMSQEVIARACKGKESLPLNDRVVLLASMQATMLLWKDLTRKYHDWLSSQLPD